MSIQTGFDIVGMLGFVLALILACLEWYRYHLPLHMRVKEMILVDSSEDTYLVLLLLAFVNPASAGKTVFHMRGGAPNSRDFSPSPYQFVENLNEVVVKLPSGEIARKVRVPELLWLPLDILPHQSQTKWYPAVIHFEKPKGLLIPSIHLRLYAYSVDGKQLAEFDREIELKTHVIY